MALAHSCRSCGRSLTRVRAGLDPHLGLRVVVCPGCGTPEVRRHHEVAQLWRSACRWRASLTSLLLKFIVCAAMVSGSIGAAAGLISGSSGVPLVRVLKHLLGVTPDARFFESWRDNLGHYEAGAELIWFLLVGAVLAFALSHVRRRWVVWAGFFGLIVVALGMGLTLEWVDRYEPARTGWPASMRPAHHPQPPLAFDWYLTALAVVSCGLVVSLLGTPFGRLAGRMLEARRRSRRRRRFAKARSRRAAA